MFILKKIIRANQFIQFNQTFRLVPRFRSWSKIFLNRKNQKSLKIKRLTRIYVDPQDITSCICLFLTEGI